MNRKLMLAVIVPVAFFLIALGVKVPDLTDNSRPKPRPRAVLENVEKTSKETYSAQQPDIAPCTSVTVVTLNPKFSFFSQDASRFTSRRSVLSLSRAPPCLPA